jgi:uncharacterized RDD family membrane protein YckC
MPDDTAFTTESPMFTFGGYGVEPTGLPKTAGFGIRLGARLIDLAVHWVVFTVSSFVSGIVLAIAVRDPARVQAIFTALRRTSVFAFVFALVGSALYHSICEGLHGSTIGKRICGLVVLNDEGQPCNLRSALGRSLAYFVDALFFGLIGYMAMRGSPLDQRKGDERFHTIVAKRKTVPPAVLRDLGSLVLVTLLAAGVDSLFAVLGIFAHLQRWG